MLKTASYFSDDARDCQFKVCISKTIPRALQYGIDGIWTELVPPAALLQGYKAGKITWAEYEDQYLKALDERKDSDEMKFIVDMLLNHEEDIVLLCWEKSPVNCHRRLAAQWLKKNFGIDMEVK